MDTTEEESKTPTTAATWLTEDAPVAEGASSGGCVSTPLSALVSKVTTSGFFSAAGGTKPDDPVDESKIDAVVARGVVVVVAELGGVDAVSPAEAVENDIDDLADQMSSLFQTGGVKKKDVDRLKAIGHLKARIEEEGAIEACAGGDSFSSGDVDSAGRTRVVERRVGVIRANDVVVIPPAAVGAYGLGRPIDVVGAQAKEAKPSSSDPACMYPYLIDSGVTPVMPVATQAATIEAWMEAEARNRLWSTVGVTRGDLLVMTNGMWFRAAPVKAVKGAVLTTQDTDPVGADGAMFAAIGTMWQLSSFVVPLTHNVHGLSFSIQDDVLIVSTAEGSVYFVNVAASLSMAIPHPLTVPASANTGLIMALHVMPLPHGSPPKDPIWTEVGTVPVLWVWSPTAAAKHMDEIATRLFSGGFRTLEEAADAPGTIGLSMADAMALASKRKELEAQQAQMRVAFHTEPGSGAPRPPAPTDHAQAWARAKTYCELWRSINAVEANTVKDAGVSDDSDDDVIGDVFALLGVTSPVVSIAVLARGGVPEDLRLDPSAMQRAQFGMGAGTIVAPKIAVAIQGGPPIVVLPASRHIVPVIMDAKYTAAVAEREAALSAADRKELATWGGRCAGSDIDTPVVMSHMAWAGKNMLVAASRDDAEWFVAVVDAVTTPPHRTPVTAQTGTALAYVLGADDNADDNADDTGSVPPPFSLDGAGDGAVTEPMVTDGARVKKTRSLSVVDDSMATTAAAGPPPPGGARRRVAGPDESAPVYGNGAMYSVARTFGATFGQLAIIQPTNGPVPADTRLVQPVRILGETRAIAARVFGGLGGDANFQVASVHGDVLSVFTCTPAGNSDVINIFVPGIDDITFLETPELVTDVLLARLAHSNDVAVISVAIDDRERGTKPTVDLFPDFVVPGGFQVSGYSVHYKSIVSTVSGQVVAFRRSASTMVAFGAGRRA